MKNIRNEIKYLAGEKGLSLGKIIELMNKKFGTSYSEQNVSNKFSRGTIRFSEVEMLLDVLGYEIEFKKKENP